MKPRPPLPPGPWLVVGLARSGLAAGRVLAQRGEEVLGVDAGHPDAGDPGFPVRLGADGLAELERVRAVVKSPGVPAEAPVIEQARRRGVPVLGELELAWRLLPQEWIAITGTNGKTTTTELVGAILREAGLPHAVVGNVGTAATSLAGAPLARDATVVAEASSFQLEDTLEFSPEAAVLLNLSPDHLDRHGTFEAYRDAKLQAFVRQGNDDVAVAPVGLGIEDLGGCARRVCVGAGGEVSEREGVVFWVDAPLLRADEIRLRGPHNLQNAMAAAAVALARGVDPDAVRAALRTFAGVAHRLEEVAERDGVLYVNDSKATNVASTVVALSAFPPGTVHLLAGGQGKNQDFAALREPAAVACRAAYTFGQDGPLVAAALEGAVDVAARATLEEVMDAARAAAQPGDVVLLSPACASFDQFRDFEQRGDRFRMLASGEHRVKTLSDSGH